VDEAKSYAEWPLARDLKPNAKPPLIVPLHQGGTISLTIDEKKNLASGLGEALWFTTNQLALSSTINSTGNLQTFRVLLSGLSLMFDPKTGNISFGTASLFVMGEPYMGGAGSWQLTSLTAPSSLRDKSPSFDISDGLGCGGGIAFELGTSGSDGINFFIIHVEASVGVEDVDGDGDFEVVCRIRKLKPWLKKKPPFPPDTPIVRPKPPVRRKRSRASR
jgi:hypothetical protein